MPTDDEMKAGEEAAQSILAAVEKAHRYSIQQVADISGLSKYQLEQWISRGYIKTLMGFGQRGKARMFTFEDLFSICVMVELNRLGLPLNTAGLMSDDLYFFEDADAVLVVWQGPAALLQSVYRGPPTPESNKEHYHERGFPIIPPEANRFYNPDDPSIWSHVVRPADLPDLVADPDKRSIMLVNLNKVEERIKAAVTGNESA